MNWNWTLVGAVLGGLSVATGAFGAHALKDQLSAEGLDWWQTAAHYHLAHALAVVLVGVVIERRPSRTAAFAAWAFTLGVALFSGSLYAMAIAGARWMGAVTPLGGLSLLAGWGSLAVATLRPPAATRPASVRE